MAVTEIIQFAATPLLDTHAPRITIDETIQRAVKTLNELNTSQHSLFGTHVQEKGAIQITSEWDDTRDSSNFETAPEFSSLVKSVRSSRGEPQSIFHVALNRSAFGRDGPATATVVEFVQVWFAASRVTLEFQKQIEDDFSRFDEIFREDARGNGSWAFGWVLEEQEHENIKGEKTKCFFVIRGWESMDCFEKSIESDAYRKAIPLLLAWNAPFKMWHVERKALVDGFEVMR